MRQLVPSIRHFVFIDAPCPELYDVEAEPGQKLNVISQNQVLAKQYRPRLAELTARYQARSGTTPLPRPVLEAREKLAALGNVQLSAPRIRGGFGKGVDPKDRIKAFESCHDISNEIGSRNIQTTMLDRLEALRKIAPEVRRLDFKAADHLAIALKLDPGLARRIPGKSQEGP